MYAQRLKSTMDQWTGNIIKSDQEILPRRTDDGAWYSQAGVELFRIIHDQVELVRDKTRGRLLYEVAKVTVASVGMFAEAQIQNASLPPPADTSQDAHYVFRLCAIANSSTSRIEDIDTLQNWIAEALDPPYCFRVNIELNMDADSHSFQVRGMTAAVASLQPSRYAEVGGWCQVASGLAVRTIFRGIIHRDISPVIDKVTSKDWYENPGELMATVVVTLEDYFSDLRVFLREAVFKVASLESIHQVWVLYVEKLLRAKGWVKEGFDEVMDEDAEVFRDFFSDVVEPSIVESYYDRLLDMKELYNAETADSAFMSFSVLSRYGFTPAMLKKALPSTKTPSSDVSLVMDQANMYECYSLTTSILCARVAYMCGLDGQGKQESGDHKRSCPCRREVTGRSTVRFCECWKQRGMRYRSQ
eukprot:scaffold246_cov414-Prasinococcus_capsulatus_cf.AAC.10